MYESSCMFSNIDGYTVSDVLMYWKPTAVLGVFDAELPQFTILGYETNDRKVLPWSNYYFLEIPLNWISFDITYNLYLHMSFFRNVWPLVSIKDSRCHSSFAEILVTLCFRRICQVFWLWCYRGFRFGLTTKRQVLALHWVNKEHHCVSFLVQLLLEDLQKLANGPMHLKSRASCENWPFVWIKFHHKLWLN